DPAVLDLDAEGDGPLLRYGQGGQPRYGLGLLGSELEAEVYDETGVLAAHFGPAAGRFDDTDHEVSLSGPNGRGGTLTWRGLPMPAGGDDPAAPLVVPARTALSARCGLGKAADAPGPAGRLTLAGLLARLRALNPLTAYGAVSLWPENDPDPGSPRLLERLEFSGPLAGGGAGDHGSLEDHPLAAARAFGWMGVQSLSGDRRALPRPRIGRAVPATRGRPAPPRAPPRRHGARPPAPRHPAATWPTPTRSVGGAPRPRASPTTAAAGGSARSAPSSCAPLAGARWSSTARASTGPTARTAAPASSTGSSRRSRPARPRSGRGRPSRRRSQRSRPRPTSASAARSSRTGPEP